MEGRKEGGKLLQRWWWWKGGVGGGRRIRATGVVRRNAGGKRRGGGVERQVQGARGAWGQDSRQKVGFAHQRTRSPGRQSFAMLFPHSHLALTTLTASSGLEGHIPHHLASCTDPPRGPRNAVFLPHSHIAGTGTASEGLSGHASHHLALDLLTSASAGQNEAVASPQAHVILWRVLRTTASCGLLGHLSHLDAQQNISPKD